MADQRLINMLTGSIDGIKRNAKNSINLLADNPHEWLASAVDKYLPNKEDERQYDSALSNGDQGYNTAYVQKLMQFTPQAGVLTGAGKQALIDILKKYEQLGASSKTIKNAVDLTSSQQNALASALSQQWGRQYTVPSSIDLKPKHGYESRIGKDGFSSTDYLNWLEKGLADEATVTIDKNGRAALQNTFVDPVRNNSYAVKVPIRGDALGAVYGDDVIPIGLFPPKK